MSKYTDGNGRSSGNGTQTRFDGIVADLDKYGKAHELFGLEGRSVRGLDPAGLLAVQETREKVVVLAHKLEAQMDEVERFTDRLHTNGPWLDVDALSEGERSDVGMWIVLGEITVRGRDKETDMTRDEFFFDLDRIHRLLDEAIADPQLFLDQAKELLTSRSEDQITYHEGIPFSIYDDGPLAAAILGHHCCVTTTEDGLMFASANKLDFSKLETLGLTAVDREDRGRTATFYVDAQGTEIVKKLYDGFAIVFPQKNDLDGNTQKLLATVLARSGRDIALQVPVLDGR